MQNLSYIASHVWRLDHDARVASAISRSSHLVREAQLADDEPVSRRRPRWWIPRPANFRAGRLV